MKGLPKIRINPEIMDNNDSNSQDKKDKRKKNESITMLIIAVGVLMLIGVLFSNGKRKRIQLEEVKKLPYHSVLVQDVKDGVYYGETSTSFIYICLEAEVKNGELKKINFITTNGKNVDDLEDIAAKMIQQNSTKVEIQRGHEFNTLVLMSCVDSALWIAEQNTIENK